MTAVRTPSLDERAAFEGWVASLAQERRARFTDHIAVARAGEPWLRAWLMDLDAHIAAGATHLPPAEMLADWDPADEELLSVEESAQVLRWLETGEGECPWPHASRD